MKKLSPLQQWHLNHGRISIHHKDSNIPVNLMTISVCYEINDNVGPYIYMYWKEFVREIGLKMILTQRWYSKM